MIYMILGCLALPGTLAAQDAQTLGLISGQKPGVPWVDALTKVFIPDVNVRISNAGQSPLSWQTAFGSGPLEPGQALSAISSGASTLGLVLPATSDFNAPLTSFGFSAPFLSANAARASMAHDETVKAVSSLAQVWRENNLVHITTLTNDSYQLLRKSETANLSDIFAGRYIAPPFIAKWFEGSEFSVQPVEVSEIPDIMNNSDVDGILAPLTFAQALGLHEIAPHIVQIDIGSFPVSHLVAYAPAWDQLAELTQLSLMAGAVKYRDYVANSIAVSTTQVIQGVLLNGGTVKRLGLEEKQRLARSLQPWGDLWIQRLEDQNGRDILDTYQNALQKSGHIEIRRW